MDAARCGIAPRADAQATTVPMATNPNDQQQLRRRIRRARRALSPQQQHAAAQTTARRIAQHAVFRPSRRVACYLVVNGAVTVTELIDRVWAGKEVYLPGLLPYRHN